MSNVITSISVLIITISVVFYACTSEMETNLNTVETSGISQQEAIPLIYHMSFISRYTKKLYFAGEAENWKLADIYSHEIEEISENIAAITEEHGEFNVGQLMESMLLPRIEQLEEAIDRGDREMFLDRFNILIQTCNQCHIATNYGSVKVTVPEINPFNQDFSRPE